MPHVPRREDPHDRRGDRRDPADGDRARAGARERRSRPPSTIREVGPRDGLQNEPEIVATADKVALDRPPRAHGLAAHRGHELRARRRHPAARRRARGAARDRRPGGRRAQRARPNSRGLDHALALREHFDEVGVFLSASETHNLKNVNRMVAASLDASRRPRAARARPACASRPSSRRASAAPTRAPSRASACSPSPRASPRRRAGDRLRRHDRDGQPVAGRARTSRRRARRSATISS